MSKSRPTPVGLPGIRARVVRGPREDGRWYWRIERSSTADKSVLECVWATSAEASRRVAEILATGEAKRAPAEASELETVDHLLGAYIAHLEDTRPDLSPATLRMYRIRRGQFDGAGLGTQRLARLQTADLEAMRGVLLRRHKPRTARGALEMLGTAWRWARREEAVPDRELVVPVVKIPREAKPVPRPQDVEAVLAAIEEPWQRLTIVLLWSTGCRIGEIASLKWDQVDLRAGEMVVKGKTGARRVPLTPRALQALREARVAAGARERVLEPSPRVVGHRLGVVLHRVTKRLGLADWTPHALRRAAVDSLARSGVDISTAAALLGHSPEVMLAHYRQVTSDDLRGAVERAGLGDAPPRSEDPHKGSAHPAKG